MRYLTRPLLTVFFLGIASGLPLALTASTLSAWLFESHVNKTAIGLFAAVATPYTLKFLWAPLMDSLRFPLLTRLLGRRRGWMLATQLAVVVSLLLMAVASPAINPWATALVAVMVAFFSASQDIVIDAYRVESLSSKEQGEGAAMVQLGYRLGMLLSSAGALFLAAKLGWQATYVTMAGVMGIGIITTLLAREPRAAADMAQNAKSFSAWLRESVVAPFADFMRHPSWWQILAFIVVYRPGLPDRAEKYIDTLKTSADHLLDLINDLLDFAKIESDSFQIESVEFDLAEQIEKVISIMNVKAREKDLNLFVNYSSALNRYFIGDPLRIHQVLMNLLSNAIKFTEKGSVEVDIQGVSETPETTLMTIKVSDTGIGIAADKLATIFDKFTQADTSITRRFGGSGLGLAISKACVEKMGGAITVDSQLGLGTTFTVSIPFKNTDKVSNVESFSIRSSPEPLKEKRRGCRR